MTKPIKPSQVASTKTLTFPSEVFDAFNELIAKNYVNGSAKVMQKTVANLIMSKMNITDLDYNLLNIEAVYEAEGWKVTYHKSPYYESWDPYFIFEG